MKRGEPGGSPERFAAEPRSLFRSPAGKRRQLHGPCEAKGEGGACWQHGDLAVHQEVRCDDANADAGPNNSAYWTTQDRSGSRTCAAGDSVLGGKGFGIVAGLDGAL